MVPAWLETAQTNEHLREALNALGEREQFRVDYRNDSRPPDPDHPPPEELPMSPEYKSLVDFYSISVGGNPVHRTSNRYADVEPYDRTRVDPGGCYLNANWVRELHGKKWWIATQAPLMNTAYTFLSVLVEQVSPPGLPTTRVRTIVQLTKDVEGGRRKAHPYFPNTVGLSSVVREQGVSDRSFEVTLIAKRIIEESHCTHSTVAITPQFQDAAQGQPVIFNHLLYTGWPDHGVPEPRDHQALINFVAQVDKINRAQTTSRDDPDPPVMVNCSAGIGRTGSFIALSSLLRAHSRLPPAPVSAQSRSLLPLSPLGPLPPEVSEDLVVQEVDSCREQRPGMVQTDAQVVFLYLILSWTLSSI